MAMALAVTKNNILTLPQHLKSISANERRRMEAQIVAAFDRELEVVQSQVTDVVERLQSVQKAETLRAMAKACEVSEDVQRKAAEGTVMLYHALGVAMVAAGYDKLSAVQRTEAVGMSAPKSKWALDLAYFGEKKIRDALAFFKSENDFPTTQRVVKYLWDSTPSQIISRQKTVAQLKSERERYEAERQQNEAVLREVAPRATVKKIAREFGFTDEQEQEGESCRVESDYRAVYGLLAEIHRLRQLCRKYGAPEHEIKDCADPSSWREAIENASELQSQIDDTNLLIERYGRGI